MTAAQPKHCMLSSPNASSFVPETEISLTSRSGSRGTRSTMLLADGSGILRHGRLLCAVLADQQASTHIMEGATRP
jgi:hypothetical protein